MPVSSAKCRANRLNAQKSTGPRTEEGKARSSQNAITHGLFCSDLLIGQETAEQLAEVEKHVMHRMRPRDVVEMVLAETYVRSFWKLRRLRGVERLTYGSEARSIQEKLKASYEARPPESPDEELSESPHASLVMLKLFNREDQMLERLSRYEHRLLGTMQRCVRELRQMQKEEIEPMEDSCEDEDLYESDLEVPDLDAADASDDAASDVQNEPTAEADGCKPSGGQRLPSPIEMPLTPRAAMLMAAVQQTLDHSANLKLKAVV